MSGVASYPDPKKIRVLASDSSRERSPQVLWVFISVICRSVKRPWLWEWQKKRLSGICAGISERVALTDYKAEPVISAA